MSVDGHTIHFAQAGDGEALILLHGINIGWGQWHPNITELGKHAKIFAVDLPGCGRSSPLDFTKSDITQNFTIPLEHFIQKNHLRKVTLLGHSFGGAVALSIAIRKKININKLILVDPIGLTSYIPFKQRGLSYSPILWLLTHTVMKMTKENMRLFLTGEMKNTKAIDDKLLNYYYDNINPPNAHPFFMLHSFMKSGKIKPEITPTQHLHAIKTPTLVVYGKYDSSMQHPSVLSAIKNIPNVQIKTFSNSGHVPNLEEPKEFNKTIIQFLAR